MGSVSRAGTRRLLPLLALAAAVIGVIATLALAEVLAGGITSGTAARRGANR